MSREGGRRGSQEVWSRMDAWVEGGVAQIVCHKSSCATEVFIQVGWRDGCVASLRCVWFVAT